MSEYEVTKVNAPKLDANPQLIVLTVEEAKEAIGDYVGVVAEVIRQCQQGVSEVKIKHPNSIVRLMEKVKQAEKGDA